MLEFEAKSEPAEGIDRAWKVGGPNHPPGTSSLVAEVTTRSGEGIDQLAAADFLDRVVADLDRIGILRLEVVILRDTRRVEYPYPVYDRSYTANVSIVRRYFASLGIDLLGRFAQFDYINADECIQRALQLAEKLNGIGEGSAFRARSVSQGLGLTPRSPFGLGLLTPDP